MEYGLNFSNFCLQMMVKSRLEKIFFKFLHAQAFSIKWIYLIESRSFDQKYKFSNKNDIVCTFQKNSCGISTYDEP